MGFSIEALLTLFQVPIETITTVGVPVIFDWQDFLLLIFLWRPSNPSDLAWASVRFAICWIMWTEKTGGNWEIP